MDAQSAHVIQPGPVIQADRIVSLDVLRGFAVLGILVMNIQSFAMIGAAYLNPTTYGDLTGVHYVVWLVSHALTDRKFMTIFTMLFGAGIVLMASRGEATGRSSAGVHYRRMGILLLFGLLHAYLLWYGDILFTYAACGLLVFLMRRWRPATLLVIGLLGVAIASAISILSHLSMPYWPVEAVENILEFWAPTAEKVREEVEAYRGNWVGQWSHRATTAFFFQTALLLIEGIWRTGGLMLVGMALFKLGVFHAKRSWATYLVMVLAGFGLGVPIILYGVKRNIAADWDVTSCFFLGGQFNYWASILVALAWVGLVMLVCKQDVLRKLTHPFAAAGQMALTNYFLQTIICTIIFYGHGFGMFGKVERLGQIGIVLVVWIVLLVVSSVWLHSFRFGPFEWLWRSLTYLRLQPIRRR